MSAVRDDLQANQEREGKQWVCVFCEHTCYQGDFQDGGNHIEHHATEDEVDAASTPIYDSVQCARLP